MPREVVWWALRYLGVDEWIVSVINARGRSRPGSEISENRSEKSLCI